MRREFKFEVDVAHVGHVKGTGVHVIAFGGMRGEAQSARTGEVRRGAETVGPQVDLHFLGGVQILQDDGIRGYLDAARQNVGLLVPRSVGVVRYRDHHDLGYGALGLVLIDVLHNIYSSFRPATGQLGEPPVNDAVHTSQIRVGALSHLGHFHLVVHHGALARDACGGGFQRPPKRTWQGSW